MGYIDGPGLAAAPFTPSVAPLAEAPLSRCVFQSCRAAGPRPQDLLWLLVLGMAGRGPVAPLEVLRQAQALGPDFTPSADVVGAVVEEVEASGAADRLDDGRLALSAHGRAALMRLMIAPARTLRGGLGRVEARLRLAFADLLPPAARTETLDRLIAAARDDLAEAARRLDLPHAGTLGRSWAAGELSEAAGTVERLRALRAGLEG
ncbi:hypothetical protein ACM64Y_15450 [Novispirillum sp. DQ9]|uniref:hypothetical protein n=1 Tax=Novispirillum sp. DQ9 TaxID=3398612 RepID=UPI003C7A6815